MYHLMVNLKVVFKHITPQKGERHKRIVSVTVIVIVCLTLAFFALIPKMFNFEKTSKWVSNGLMISYFILSIVYITFTCLLKGTLKKMDDFGDFSEEQGIVIR